MILEAPGKIVERRRRVNLKGHVRDLDPQTRIRRKVVLGQENVIAAVTKVVVEAEIDMAVVVGKINPAEVLTAADFQSLERGHDPGSTTNHRGHGNLQPPLLVVLQRIPPDPPNSPHLMKALDIHAEKVNTALKCIQMMFPKLGLLENQE